MDMEASVAATSSQRYVLKAKAGGAIIYTFSPEANTGGIPQWVVKAPDGTVVYCINQVKPGPAPDSTGGYTIKTRDGGLVAVLEPLPLMGSWGLKAKAGGSLIVSYGQLPGVVKSWAIRAPDGTIVYSIVPLPTPTTTGALPVYNINSRDGKPIYILAQVP